jgi:diadenosine tetraphosphate (Ap4A) HIT family hydrolase
MTAVRAPSRVEGCPLCQAAGGRVVFEVPEFRVIHAEEAGFPAFYRVIWRDHAAEFSDLSPTERALCMDVVVLVEQSLRTHLRLPPTKINLAAFGNMVPHLHWHVIARFDWDSHFPAPVWAAAQRDRDAGRETALAAQLPAAEAAMIAALTRRTS